MAPGKRLPGERGRSQAWPPRCRRWPLARPGQRLPVPVGARPPASWHGSARSGGRESHFSKARGLTQHLFVFYYKKIQNPNGAVIRLPSARRRGRKRSGYGRSEAGRRPTRGTSTWGGLLPRDSTPALSTPAPGAPASLAPLPQSLYTI